MSGGAPRTRPHPGGRLLPGGAVAADRAAGGAPPFAIYRALRSINPSPYMFYLALGDFEVAGASPELLVRVEDGEVAIHPIAGTRRRGADAEEDAALEAELRADEKERAEHVMLVDLGRNDVGRVSAAGQRARHAVHGRRALLARDAPRLPRHGRLRAGLHAVRRAAGGLPRGHGSGAPKMRAMEIIAELEGSAAASMPARSATSASTATWTRASPSARWCSRTAWPTCRRAAASSPTRDPTPSTRRR